MPHDSYPEFVDALAQADKERCVHLALSLLGSEVVDVETLYTDFLTQAINDLSCSTADGEELCIWKEHARSAIVRTIIECAYTFVLRERQGVSVSTDGPSGDHHPVIVMCPEGELHELGARMVADYFTIAGYDTTFVGSSTPREDFLGAVAELKPVYVAVSVTNYFNLIEAKKAIALIRETSPGTKVLVGGNAFRRNPEAAASVGADLLIHTSDDIRALSRGDWR